MHSYHVALPLEPFETNRFYSKQPLHCTILHWVTAANVPEAKIISSCQDLARTIAPLTLVISGERLLGDNKDIPVYTVRSLHLETAHMLFMEQFLDLGCSLSEPDYFGRGYNAHITKRANTRLLICGTINVETFYLAKRESCVNPPGTRGNSHIIASFKFSKKSYQP